MDIIDQFFDKKLITTPSTKRNYRTNIQSYFKQLGKSIDTYFKNGYTLEDYDNDLRRIYTQQHKEGRPDLSMKSFFNPIKQFMVTNNKQLKDLEFWDILKARTRGAEPESNDAIFNASDIKEILSHGNACSRALFLMLASSGRRISEILALTPDDINTSVNPTTINITKGLKRSQTKTKQKTLCFISDEATQAYKTWMLERDEYLITSTKRNYKFAKHENDPRIFPMSYSNAIVIWSNLLIRAQLVDVKKIDNKWHKGNKIKIIERKNKGDRLMHHPQCLRRFYRSYLGDADLAEYLMGHSTLLTRTYRQMKPEDLAKKYQDVMHNVTIFESPLDLTEINKKQQDLEKANMEKDKQIQNMQLEMQDMKMKLLELYVEKHEKQINGNTTQKKKE